jgi:hypothetical protein
MTLRRHLVPGRVVSYRVQGRRDRRRLQILFPTAAIDEAERNANQFFHDGLSLCIAIP